LPVDDARADGRGWASGPDVELGYLQKQLAQST